MASLAALLRLGSPAVLGNRQLVGAAVITKYLAAPSAVVFGLLARKPVLAIVAPAKRKGERISP